MQGAGPLFVLIVIVLFLTNAIKLLREWERGVVLRLGKFQAVRGPGLIFVIPGIERLYRVNTRVITVDVPPQDVITKDNVTLKVNAVVFFHIFGPKETIINVEDRYSATFQKSQTILRGVSRSIPWKSNTLICRRKCSGPWRNRPKPNASGAPRSFRQRASIKPRHG
jgi:regulator of protease activity HflC (stomatin/prohibitin superfamily)